MCGVVWRGTASVVQRWWVDGAAGCGAVGLVALRGVWRWRGAVGLGVVVLVLAVNPAWLGAAGFGGQSCVLLLLVLAVNPWRFSAAGLGGKN